MKPTIAAIIVTAEQLHDLRNSVGILATAAELLSRNLNEEERMAFKDMAERHGKLATEILDTIGGVG